MADLESLSREELIALVLEQQRLTEELRAEIEKLKRSQHRSAAPFSKGRRKADPKRAGRKPGQGPFTRRSAPEGPASQTVQAEVPPNCPFCGGRLEQEGEETATTTDVPTKPEPVTTLYRVPVCRCQKCGQRVRGTAAGLAPDQAGATAHRVGPGVMAAAHALHYAVGIPVRKVPGVLRELTGIQLTQSAITQDALRRMAGPVGAAYEELRGGVREAPVVHTDDTGWRIGGETAFLMGFDTDQATVYQIRDQHRNEEVREIIPSDYKGVMVSDRGKSYEAEELDGVAQQKCLTHLLRNVSEVVKSKQGRARQFGEKLMVLLRISARYVYAAGQNDGKIQSQTDNLTGEQVVSQYAELNRPIKAETAGSQREFRAADGGQAADAIHGILRQRVVARILIARVITFLPTNAPLTLEPAARAELSCWMEAQRSGS
jgi:transposase